MPASAYFSFYPLSALRATSPTRRTRPFCRYRDISPVSAGESTPKEEARFVFARKRSDEANSREGEGLRSIFSVLFQGDCRGTSCLAMTTIRAIVRWDISLALNMTCFSTLPGDCVANCYSALNACALKLSFSAFFIKNASAL